jgi:hypothetical protein
MLGPGTISADPEVKLQNFSILKLVLFGSTGGTGRELVRQALELGHEVTAFARRAQAVGITSAFE